ncbi:MAG: hypothetical protein HZA90_14205 [Verrucomicrobia bacterium]|nr:hypothetical protein [Verrucomicrobiota bacterium]
MSEFQVIQGAVEKAARRRRWQRAWRGFWIGLLAGTVLCLAVLVAFKLAPLPYWALAAAGLAAAICAATGFTVGGWRPVSLSETARWIDREQVLKERLSTALEVAPTESEWSQLLVHDAARHAEGLDPRRLLPFHLPRAARWAALVLAVAAGLGFVPEHRSKAYRQKLNDAAIVSDTGKQLADLTKRSLEQRPPALEPTQKAMLSVAELGQKLERVPLTKSDALRELANAAEKLSKEAQQLARNPALKPLERAARDAGSGIGNKTPEELQRQIDSLQKSIGDKATPDGLDKLKNNLQQAQQAAKEMKDQQGANTDALRQQLAQSLAALAQESHDLGQPMDSLDEAIKALEKGQIGQVLKDLDIAEQDLEKLSEMAKNLAKCQQQMSQLGKDLAEQLENGQAEAARDTLEKMTKQLQAPGLASEQLQKMLEEVSKAVSPASDYGKVAEHLKNAAKQMQQAQQSGSNQAKSQAAQELAAAAKELEQLAQQASDAQSLSAMLNGLSQAQQAIASGKGWGQCKKPGACGHCNGQGCAMCKGTGWAHGGRNSPSGVGTWADENEGWTYYPDKVPQTPVDNSSVQRPDLDPRGLSDRGPGEKSDALRPSQVKGKFSPGGPMPSITLRGVSIKGTSNVKFEDAATAAQSEAQSALNQDQVPRAYQSAVKDYFDDFKK